ncbi:MAG: ComEC/Rec2 family competence protein [Ruminococcus sp.]|nr:ComEC/Rec2 family competence protein [Ruminococcus sp.]
MTKRLFAYIGLSMLAAFTVVFYFGHLGAAFLAVFAVSLIVITLVFKLGVKSTAILISAVLIASTAYFEVYRYFFDKRSEVYENQTVGLTAVVKDTPHMSYDVFYYELESREVNENDEKIKILFKSSYDLNLEYGDVLTCNAVLTKCDNDYYRSKRYLYIASESEDGFDYNVEKPGQKGIDYIPIFLRERFTHAISVLMTGYEGELCNAIVFGDKFGLSKDLYNSFTNTGLSYIIVVSGMHMTIIAAFILKLFKPLGRRRWEQLVRMTFCIVFIVLYMFITGCSSSVVRSGIMTIIYVIGFGVSRRSDTYNRLGFAAIFLTALNPLAVGDVGLLLSFASVIGIVYLQPKMQGWFESKTHIDGKLSELATENKRSFKISIKIKSIKLIKNTFNTLSTSTAAVIAISPITLICFGVCNPLVIISSQFIVPLMQLLMICTFLSAVLWYCPILNFFAYSLSFIAHWIAWWTIKVVNFMANLPFGSIFANPTYMKWWFAAVLLIFAAAMLFKNRKKSISIGIFISVALLAVGYPVHLALTENNVTLNVMNAGNGTTVWLSSAEGNDILSCGGSLSERSSVFEEIRTTTSGIDFLLVPSANKSECSYAADFISEFDVKGVLLYHRYNTSENAYRRAEKLDKFNVFSENDRVNVRLLNGFTDYVVNVKNHTWQYLDCGEKTVLIAPKGGKLTEISTSFKKADILILNSYIDNIETLDCETVIWSSHKPVPQELSDRAIKTDNTYVISLN